MSGVDTLLAKTLGARVKGTPRLSSNSYSRTQGK